MSLPDQMIKDIQEESSNLLEKRLIENKKLLHQKKLELEELETNLHSVESKWINNQMAHDTCHRWHGELTDKIRLKKSRNRKVRQGPGQCSIAVYTTKMTSIEPPISWKSSIITY